MIRKATAADEMQIRECAVKAYARYVQRIGRVPAPMVADYESQIAAGYAFIATDDQGTFQGFVIFYAADVHMLLENVAVLPEAAGHGVGRTLIAFCENAARDRGFKAVHLYTNEMMTENLTMYAKLGYVEVARRFENGFSRVYFEKVLD